MSDPILARCELGHTAYVDGDGGVWLLGAGGHAMLADVEPEKCPACGLPLTCVTDESDRALMHESAATHESAKEK
jgi:hypothetical protein